MKTYKFFSLILIFIFIFTTMSIQPHQIVRADSVFEDFEYIFDNAGKVIITGYSGSDDVITIPSKINGVDVVEISDGAISGDEDANTIVIPEGIVKIDDYAITDCSLIESVTIPSSVVDISGLSFYNNPKLTNINVADSNSKYISLSGVVYAKDLSNIVAYPGGRTDKSYSINSGTLAVNDYAFAGAENLTEIIFPTEVISINDGAFYGCASIANLLLPINLGYISPSAFQNMDSLVNINISNAKFSSADGILYSNDKSVLIKYPQGLKAESFTIPNSVTTIGETAFSGNIYIKTITLSDSVNNIYKNSFSDCDNLVNLNAGANNANFTSNNGVLMNKMQTTLLIYPNGKSDKNYIVPNSVTSIAEDVFAGNDALESITILKNVINFPEDIFGGSDSVKIICEKGSAAEIYAETNDLVYQYIDGRYPDKDITVVYNGKQVTIKMGQIFAKPTKPKKSGYTFLGWYDDQEFSQVHDFSQVVERDTEIFAKFAKNPAAPKLNVKKVKKGVIFASWNVVKTQYYKVEISLKRNVGFKPVTKYIKGVGKFTKKKLTSKKFYYVRVMTYKVSDKIKVYSSYSKVVKVKA